MTTLIWIVAIALVATGAGVIVRRWRRATEPRLITCPETGRRESVEIDPMHQLRHATAGHPEDLKLRSCSRWPERQDCDQPCRTQIAEAPDGCRVRTVLDAFYVGHSCSACGRDFGEKVEWSLHTPGLRTAEGLVTTWKDLPTADLESALASAEPVCWDCLQVARVYEKHPELVTQRDDREPVVREGSHARQAQG